MLRNILAIIAGLAAGIVVIFIMEFVGHGIYPPPAGFDPTDEAAMENVMMQAPVGALLMVILAYILGSFAGGFVASQLSRSAPLRNAIIVGILLLIAGVVNVFMIPHPVWYLVLSMAVYLPFAYLGGKLGLKFRKPANKEISNH